ncbi:MAG: hypothetical protein J0I70_09295 [Microbacterium sp.]|uniref:hypothetical protein n=1 Tax=Microbacterium sp. TaxID=51671 RepID=UPI001ACACF6C|nr:hypothetical protein [Microbacterium sp.]MBN9153211.1 hypothetical protein [Microbacterium sp.]MBN9174330.1 hypothetical protein [Microbacterium sp.]
MTTTVSRPALSPALPSAPRMPRRAARPWAVPAVLALVAVVCWLVALPSLRSASYSGFGLLFAGSPLFAVSIALIAVAFVLAIARRTWRMAGVALILSVLILRLPTALATTEPLYSWTYKHFGVIDYIQTHGGLAQGVDIYQEWPGAFSFFAWLNTLTGTTNEQVALWFTVSVQLVLAGSVYLLARSVGLSVGAGLVAGYIAQAANWVGQDYLSPQALAFALGTVVLALMLASPRSRAAAWIGLVLFVAIVVSHQLTPYWLIAVVLVLTLLGRVRPRYMIALFIAIAVGYMLLHLQTVLQFGNPLNLDLAQNVQTVQRGTEPSAGQRFSSWGSRLTVVLVCGGTAAILVTRLIRHRSGWRDTVALGAIAFSSGLILGGQSYGGEAVLRVFLYSLPGCAIVLAPVIERALTGGVARATRLVRVSTAVALTAVTLMSAQAYYGAWFANYITPESVRVSTELLEEEPVNTLTIGVAPGAPGRLVARYVEFVQAHREFDAGVDTWINAWPGWKDYDFRDPTKFHDLTTRLIATDQPTTVIITEQMLYYSEYYGIFEPGSLERFRDILLNDPRWRLVHRTPDLLMFRLQMDASGSFG